MTYTDLLGTKFKIHGRNKSEGFDCYGLAIEVLRRNGIVMKDVFYENLDSRQIVHDELHSSIPNKKLENPKLNCIVEIADHGQPLHIAVYIGNGQIIHTTQNTNVVIESLKKYKNKIRGYYEITGSN